MESDIWVMKKYKSAFFSIPVEVLTDFLFDCQDQILKKYKKGVFRLFEKFEIDVQTKISNGLEVARRYEVCPQKVLCRQAVQEKSYRKNKMDDFCRFWLPPRVKLPHVHFDFNGDQNGFYSSHFLLDYKMRTEQL